MVSGTVQSFLKCSTGGILLSDTGDHLLNSDAEDGHEHCIFCHATADRGFRIIWEDDIYKVFYDHRPATACHLQLIPKRHIDSVKFMNKDDVTMVKEMEILGHRILDDMNVPRTLHRLGFHIPPFTSVTHLHLHVQGLPYRSWPDKVKFPVARGRGGFEKGLSWFVEIDQAIRILEKGSYVGVLPC
ncbi:HIT-like protein [Amylocystis lapponica]|nr:HIT-like protein [Amylocystis lapponica]